MVKSKPVRTADELEHELKLRDAENASLKRQVESLSDTLDALAWERRAIGVVAKTLCEQLQRQEDDGDGDSRGQ